MEENKTTEVIETSTTSEGFKAITTQEQFDSAIKERLARQEKKHSEATAELQKALDSATSERDALSAKLEEASAKYAGFDEQLAQLQAKVKEYETDSVKTRIAKDAGLPYEMRDRLRGETEEELVADAQALAALLPKNVTRKSTETIIGADDEEKASLREMLKTL